MNVCKEDESQHSIIWIWFAGLMEILFRLRVVFAVYFMFMVSRAKIFTRESRAILPISKHTNTRKQLKINAFLLRTHHIERSLFEVINWSLEIHSFLLLLEIPNVLWASYGGGNVWQVSFITSQLFFAAK